ncbi:MAG TPA: sulfotransferase, partial [Acidimicrobiales bacterium]|nr:sulfotransferase [Acidimicrobiales bacterium]
MEALNPGFQAIHPSGPERAQECVSIYAGDFRSLLYSTVFDVPSYTRWLLWDADMSSAYRYHRRFLQLLQWRHPGERWLLKSPAHQWHLKELFTEYPNATIVHTHRDPLKVIASTASLASFLHRVASDGTSIAALAPDWAEWLVLGDDRSVDGREDGTVPAGRAVDLHYRNFMAAPFDAIAAVYGSIGVAFTDEAEQAMKQFLTDNAADKHGVHQYTFSATGLDVETMRRRTARYERYFNVEREELG